jgi:hypothetical protein
MAVLQEEQTFIVRRANSLDDLQWVFEKATEEGWRTSAMDANNYFTAGVMQDFFIGELDGERISCVVLIKHSETCVFVGYYITVPAHRGKGYGWKTWKTAFDAFETKPDVEFQLYSVLTAYDLYLKLPVGFRPGWRAGRCEFPCARAAQCLSNFEVPSAVAKVMLCSRANFQELVAYGIDMFISSRASELILAAYLSNARESSWVAIGNKGEVLGYLIMSKTSRFPEEGYRIAPLFADSTPVARILLKKAVEYAFPKNPGSLFLDFPREINIEGANMFIKEFGGKYLFDTVFMGTKGVPDVPLKKVFGFASIEVML